MVGNSPFGVADGSIGDELGDDGLHLALGNCVSLEHGVDVLSQSRSPARPGCLLRTGQDLARELGVRLGAPLLALALLGLRSLLGGRFRRIGIGRLRKFGRRRLGARTWLRGSRRCRGWSRRRECA